MPEQPWYETAPASSVRVLRSLRTYRAAEQAMRRRTRESMKMGEADLRALRFLLKSEAEGKPVTPNDLAVLLGMKSSSITIMLDRLTASGHIRRAPHPSDRRSIVITATPGADEEVRETLGDMHRRLLSVAAALDEDQAEVVTAFLASLTASLDRMSEAEGPAAGHIENSQQK
jgi:DNA-binding MarR family transcriptional regulator